MSLGKKDSVLRGYKNFDVAKQQPRQVKVYQSLTPHYSELRNTIVNFFASDADPVTKFGISNHNKQLKWAVYQSPSAGIVVKLRSNEYMRDIHVWDDFISEFGKCLKPQAT